MLVSEELGAAPVCADGKVGGNGALLCDDGSIVVSRSGRIAGSSFDATQFVRVLSFDRSNWTATYESSCDSIKPSSDTPLLWHALKYAPEQFHWENKPKFVLHGHTCETAEEARALNLPCSPVETLFSTPQDLEALLQMMEQHPYPKDQIYVRLNHGFFLLSQTHHQAIELFQKKLIRSKL